MAAVAPRARVFLLREYTKRYEQQLLGTASEVRAALDVPVRGEIAFVVDSQQRRFEPAPPAGAPLEERIDAMLAEDRAVSAIAKALADEGYGERRHIYARVTERKRVQRESPRP